MERPEGIKQKPENNDNNSPEYISELPSVRQQLESLASDEALSSELANLQYDLANDPDYLMFPAIETEIDQLGAELRETESTTRAFQVRTQIRDLEKDLQSNSKYINYIHSKETAKILQQSPTRLVYENSPEAKLLLGALQSETGINPLNDQAPFMDYKSNTTEAWKYVPDEAVKDYLDGFHFMNDNMRLEGNKVLLRNDRNNDPFTVPTSLFASAPGFESWSGRSDANGKGWNSDYGLGVASSIDVMKHYASLPTELPAVELVNVFVRPDGRMFARNYEGSHRVGAAFLRGDTTVKAENVNFVMLERNILNDQAM